MKKHLHLYIITCLLSACGMINNKTAVINAEIENTHDVAKIVGYYVNPETESQGYQECVSKCTKYWSGCMTCDICPFECKIPFLEQNMQYECLEDDYNDYHSDNCILYRRNLHPSKVAYFDYKRLLPQDTFVDTDEKFLEMAEYYKNIKENLEKCSTEGGEKTSQEIQSCKNNLFKPLYQYERFGMKPCMDSAPEEYKESLQKTIKWYKWAIDHDPYGQIKILKKTEQETGLPTGWQYIYPDPVWSKSEAQEEAIEDIQSFGKTHLCSTDSYKNDLQKLGFKF